MNLYMVKTIYQSNLSSYIAIYLIAILAVVVLTNHSSKHTYKSQHEAILIMINGYDYD